LWLWNPVAIVLATRGSWDCLVALLVVAALRAGERGDALGAGYLVGLAAHLRLYPVIYAPAFALQLLRKSPRSALAFCAAFAVFLAVPTALSHASYGAYASEALLYHVSREDHRHNFSAFWLPVYLARALGDERLRALLRLAPFLAHLGLQGAALLGLSRDGDLGECLMGQTLLFVAANKVCTAQYVAWWLPLAAALARPAPVDAIVNWVGATGLWLVVAYGLEFLGFGVHAALWLCSLLVFRANIGIYEALVAKEAPEEAPAAPAAPVRVTIDPPLMKELRSVPLETDRWSDVASDSDEINSPDPVPASWKEAVGDCERR